MTACQVYWMEKEKMYIFQIRSSLAKGRRDEFLEDLLKWCKDKKVSEVIFLGSSSAEERLDGQLKGTQLRYVTFREENKAEFEKLGWTVLERRDRFPGLPSGREAEEDEGLFVPGGGFAKRALLMAKELGVPATLLLSFCSEGDNSHDAARLVRYMDEWIGMLPKDSSGNPALRTPPSWSLLFGNPLPATIF